MTEYRWVGTHAQEFTIVSADDKDEPKRVWKAPGEFVELSEDDLKGDPLAKELVDSGMLMNVEEFNKAAKAEAAPKNNQSPAAAGDK